MSSLIENGDDSQINQINFEDFIKKSNTKFIEYMTYLEAQYHFVKSENNEAAKI